ncbi:MAG: ATP-binding protein [bacterium]|nr:ATP-binding protein [bacterium]
MERFFNTAGPIVKENHYCVDPLSRFNLDEIRSLIRQQKYFVLHAPRQTGKTSYLLALLELLNKEGKYKCLYANIEMAQAARENVEEGIHSVINAIARNAVDYLEDSFLRENWLQIFRESGPYSACLDALSQWSKHSEKPIVLFIDEVDSLVGDTLISLLRQLRAGYTKRPRFFPQSIILCGVRDVRDYRIHSDKEKSMVTGGSAFNIKAESLRLDSFSPKEVHTLLLQHTRATGQVFEDDVFPLIWDLTEGQPWLVNALAYETCFRMKEMKDRTKPITAGILDKAKENLILRRETHLDQLTDKLGEDRVRRVIEPILSGSGQAETLATDDVEYVEDLGLIKTKPQLEISNRIYREVIPRALIYTTQATIAHQTQWYLDDSGYLDMDKLLTAFQAFFRKNYDSWVGGFKYEEAGPQLLLQAFLQRVINGGGQVKREYGLGLQRTDLFLKWPHPAGIQEVVLELKIRYNTTEKTIAKGLVQTLSYMDTCGTSNGYLLIFDRRKKTAWKDKIFKETRTIKGTKITVFGM